MNSDSPHTPPAQAEKTPPQRARRIRRYTLRSLLALLLLLLATAFTLTLTPVQTWLGHWATDKLNRKLHTRIQVDRLSISLFGTLQLKGVMIRDHHQDTLICAKAIRTSILNWERLMKGKLFFAPIDADQLQLHIHRYRGERYANIDYFINCVDDGKPGSGRFRMFSRCIRVHDGRFRMIDDNRAKPLDVDFTHLNLKADDFQIKGPNIFAQIDALSFHDHRGVEVERLRADFVYTRQSIRLYKLRLKTSRSYLKGQAILRYHKGDFAQFNNKVKWEVDVDMGAVSSNDIRCFFKGMGRNLRFLFRSKIQGTLNNFYCIDLSLKDNHNTRVVGDVNFRNLFNNSPGEFYMNGRFQRVSSTYGNLITLLPDILKNKLPGVVAKLGYFSLTGRTKLTKHFIDTDFYLSTLLGNLDANLHITHLNQIDKASYQGQLYFDQFHMGNFAQLSQVGRITAQLDVTGKGFKQAFLDTDFKGDIRQLEYKGYAYSQLRVDGGYQRSVFTGAVNSNDPNLRMDFNGSVDFNQKVKRYNFEAQIDYANLNRLRFVRDSIGVFKGHLNCLVDGTHLDDIVGQVQLSDASYQNSKDLYFFDRLDLQSNFDEQGERHIQIVSPDIVKGEVSGKFRFGEIQQLVENCLGSLYSNYSPNKVSPGQYINYDVQLFSKFVEIFYPPMTIAPQTVLRGKISSETQNFKMELRAPYLTLHQVHMDGLHVDIDNKKPEYTALIDMDSLQTPVYRSRDIHLLNTTARDTSFFAIKARGGKLGDDQFDLKLYHTIDLYRNNVVGFQNSNILFKGQDWQLTPSANARNRVVFDKKLREFNFESVVAAHGDQKISLYGMLSGRQNKDLELAFDQVDLQKITPDIKQLGLEGVVDGFAKIKQREGQYQPTALLAIDHLKVNQIDMGKLDLDIKGDDSLQHFDIDALLHNHNVDLFKAQGQLDLRGQQSVLGVDIDFDRFNLGILNPFGGDVIHKIRGFASGKARIEGPVGQLDYFGTLSIDGAGLQIPYLNTDYRFKDGSKVAISRNKFSIPPAEIFDTQFQTRGTLSGNITHKEFGDWALNLFVQSPRMLVLNTVDHEGAAYYGKAYINGEASITGPMNGLVVKMKASSEKGTDIKIPISEAQAAQQDSYIHFLTPDEKKKIVKKSSVIQRNYYGLELDFELDILENADIEVILNKETQHGMKGNGRGTLLFQINTLGKFEMTGDFQVYKGRYNFNYGNLISKTFEVKKFGSIVWEGDPMKATLNLEAVYKTQANPAVLIDNASFNRKVNVDVVIGVRGTLSNPEPDFNIQFPQVSSVLRSEIQTRLDDKDMRQTQALSLLSTGSFLSPEGLDQTQFANNLYERAGNLLKDLFQDQNGKMQLSLDYVQGDKSVNNSLQNAGRFGVTVTTQINERVTINGKVGVPVGGINESAIVGNVELLYRVNEDGTLNLRVFNRENDINYIGQGIGYTQGVGLTYEVDFNTFKELTNRIFKKIKIDTVRPTTLPQPETGFPENIEMKKDKPSTPDDQTPKAEVPKEAVRRE